MSAYNPDVCIWRQQTNSIVAISLVKLQAKGPLARILAQAFVDPDCCGSQYIYDTTTTRGMHK